MMSKLVTLTNGTKLVSIRTLLEIIIVLVSIGMMWATIQNKVGNNSEAINRNTTSIDKNRTEFITDMSKIQSDMVEIKGSLREMNVKQSTIEVAIADIKVDLKSHIRANP